MAKHSIDHTVSSTPPPDLADLQLPASLPLDEAVANGLFGETEDGSSRPNAEEVRTLTEEWFYEAFAIWVEYQWLVECSSNGANLHTGKSPRSRDQRDQNREIARQNAKLALDRYNDCLGTYEEAFGEEGAKALDDCVKATFEADRLKTPDIFQQELF